MGVLKVSVIPRVPRHVTPSRPSGADKEKERAQNEGGGGAGLNGRPLERADGLPRRHRLSQPSCSTAKVAEQGKSRVNRASAAELLADAAGAWQAVPPVRSVLLSFAACTLIAFIQAHSLVLAARRARALLPLKSPGAGSSPSLRKGRGRRAYSARPFLAGAFRRAVLGVLAAPDRASRRALRPHLSASSSRPVLVPAGGARRRPSA